MGPGIANSRSLRISGHVHLPTGSFLCQVSGLFFTRYWAFLRTRSCLLLVQHILIIIGINLPEGVLVTAQEQRGDSIPVDPAWFAEDPADVYESLGTISLVLRLFILLSILQEYTSAPIARAIRVPSRIGTPQIVQITLAMMGPAISPASFPIPI